MKRLFCVMALTASLMLCSCTTTNNAQKIQDGMNAYLGKTMADVIQVWGSPQEVQPDGQGGQILVYKKTQEVSQIYYPYYGSVGQVITKQETVYANFFVNSNNIVYHWRAGTE